MSEDSSTTRSNNRRQHNDSLVCESVELSEFPALTSPTCQDAANFVPTVLSVQNSVSNPNLIPTAAPNPLSTPRAAAAAEIRPPLGRRRTNESDDGASYVSGQPSTYDTSDFFTRHQNNNPNGSTSQRFQTSSLNNHNNNNHVTAAQSSVLIPVLPRTSNPSNRSPAESEAGTTTKGGRSRLVSFQPLLSPGQALVHSRSDSGSNYSEPFDSSKDHDTKRENEKSKHSEEEDPDDPRYNFNGFHLHQHELRTLLVPSSFFVFSGDHILRIRCLQIARNTWFQRVIFVAIILNSILLGVDWPAVEYPPVIDNLLRICDLIFLCIFSAEMIIKMIALGLVLHPGAYLRSPWNVLDIITIIISVVQIAVQQRSLAALRALRVLRPLRSVSRIPDLKLLVGSLLRAIPQVLDNLLLFVFLIVIFALAGMELFRDGLSHHCFATVSDQNGHVGYFPDLLHPQYCGGLYECTRVVNLSSPGVGRISLEGNASWTPAMMADPVVPFQCQAHLTIRPNPYGNFDSFYRACFTVFKIAVSDDWSEQLRELGDARGGPSFGYQSVLYCVMLVVLGTWYCINVFLGILTSTYSSKRREFTEAITARHMLPRHAEVQVDMDLDEAMLVSIDQIETRLERNKGTKTRFGYFEYESVIRTRAPSSALYDLTIARSIAITDEGNSSNDDEDNPFSSSGRSAKKGHHDRLQPGFTYLDIFHDDLNVPVPAGLVDPDSEGSSDSDREDSNGSDDAASSDAEAEAQLWLQSHNAKKSAFFQDECAMLNATRRAAFTASFEKAELELDDDAANSNPSGGRDEQQEMGSSVTSGNDRKAASTKKPNLSNEEKTPEEMGGEGNNHCSLRQAQDSVESVVGSWWWEPAILLVTIVNVVVLAIDYYGIPDETANILDILSYICTAIFAVDCLLKIFAYGLCPYLSLGANKLDFLLVLVSIVDIVVGGGGSSAFSALRVFRAFRMLRLLKGSQSMKALLLCVIFSLSSAVWLTFLLCLTLFIYAVLGMQLFGTSYDFRNAPSDPTPCRDSFGTLWEAALSAFIVATGESWTRRVSNGDSFRTFGEQTIVVLYFFSLFVIGNYILLNLFVAILLDTLSETMEQQDEETRFMPNLVMPNATLRPPNAAFALLAGGSAARSMNPLGRPDVFAEELDSLSISPTPSVPGRAGAHHDHAAAAAGRKPLLKPRRAGFHDVLAQFDARAVIKDALRYLFGDRGCVVGGDALYVFSPENPIRRLAVRAVTCNAFDWLINGMLVVNVIVIILDSPIQQGKMDVVIEWSNLVLAIAFVAEMVLKIVAFGLVSPQGIARDQVTDNEWASWEIYPAYLLIGWNALDGIVAVSSLISVLVGGNFNTRVLRTARLIHRIGPLRAVVVSLLQALPFVFNALLLLLFVFTVFAIVGVQLFKGTFYSCNDPAIGPRSLCIGNYTAEVDGILGPMNVTVARQWVQEDFHFDHFGAAMLTIFMITIGDGWSSIMYTSMDVVGIDQGLSYYASPYYCLYFVAVYFLCNFCGLNMIVGVMVNYYQKVKDLQDGSALLTPEQRDYVNARHAIEGAALQFDERPIDWVVSHFFHTLLTARPWQLLAKDSPQIARTQTSWRSFSLAELLSTLTVIVNTVALAMNSVDIDRQMFDILSKINFVCLILFSVEMVMKLIAYFPRQYYLSPWNVLDTIVVVSGWLDLFVESAPGLTFLRVLRMLRLVRGTGVARIIAVTIACFHNFANALLMIILLLFIYAAIGVQLFGEFPFVGAISENTNFLTLLNGMLVLFQCITTDDWTSVMLSLLDAPTAADHIWMRAVIYLYMITYMIFGYCVVLQLFTAVVVEVFEKNNDSTSSVASQARSDFEMLRLEWISSFGPDASETSVAEFVALLGRLPPTLLGFQGTTQSFRKSVELVHFLASLHLPVTSRGTVAYKNIVNALALRRFSVDVETVGGLIHGIIFDQLLSNSFTVGEAYCAEIVQASWEDYQLRQKIGTVAFEKLRWMPRCNGIFAMPSEKSVSAMIHRSTRASFEVNCENGNVE